MVENIARCNNAPGNVGTEFGNRAVFEISRAAIFDGIDLLNAGLNRGEISWKFDGFQFLNGI